ncbi:MAG: hypothetical protein ACOYH0_03610 [Saccharofermentanales bacterium]|jgi:hypothetical protein
MVANFIRFTETLKTKEEMRVVSITVRPVIADCTGTIWFTDLQAQEGDRLTGYTPHTSTMLRSSPNPPRYHNGVVRTGDTLIIFNLGETSSGLDCYIYPIQDMEAGSVALSQGAGSHKMCFLAAANAGDELALLSSTRECLKNGSPTPKQGFFQYSAAHDSKHQVQLQERKSARVYFEYREMLKGQDRP